MSLARAASIVVLSSSMSLPGMATAYASPPAPGGDRVDDAPLDLAAPDADAPKTDATDGEGPPSEASGASDSSWLEDALSRESYDRFKEGLTLDEEKRYLEAAMAYERSYTAVPTGRALYNMGLSYERGGDIVRSLEAYVRYVALPDCPAPQAFCADEKRGEVQATIRRLKALVGVLTIVLDDGVDLRGIDIDGRTVQLDDFPLILDPGRYELRIRGRKRGQVQIRQVEIEAGQRASLVIPGFDQPAPMVVPPTSSGTPDPVQPPRITPEERRRRLKIAFYGGVGLTGLSAVAMSITGGLALSAFRRQDGRCKGENMACPDTVYPADDRDRVTRLTPVTNVFVGVTAGLGLTTVVVGLFAFSRAGDKSTSTQRAGVGRVQASPTGLKIRF